MGILDEFYKEQSNEPAKPLPNVPPVVTPSTTQDGADTQILGSNTSSNTYRLPSTTVSTQQPYTTTKTTPKSYTIGKNENVTKYQQNKDYNILTQPEFEEKYKPASASVMAKLGMEKPLPVDNERNRRIMGYQAIGEALRNVVDAVQGKRKAIIGKHKSYTNEFANKIAKDDANYANQLKEYYKTLNDAQKQASDDYMKYLLSESARAGIKVSQGSNYKETPAQVVTTETGPKQTISNTTGGGTTGTSYTQREAIVPQYGDGEGGEPKTFKEIKLQDGSVYVLDDKNLRMSADLVARYRGGKSFGALGDKLYERMTNGEKLTNDEYAQLVEAGANSNIEIAKAVARATNIPQTQKGTGTKAGEVLKKNTQTQTKKNTQTQTKSPVIDKTKKVIKNQNTDPFAQFGGKAR